MSDAPDRTGAAGKDLLTPRRITAAVLAAVALVFVLQNRDEVTLQFLGIRLSATLWFASLVLLVVGIAIGALWTSRRTSR